MTGDGTLSPPNIEGRSRGIGNMVFEDALSGVLEGRINTGFRRESRASVRYEGAHFLKTQRHTARIDDAWEA